jgi:hypothetical protein
MKTKKKTFEMCMFAFKNAWTDAYWMHIWMYGKKILG